MEEDVTNGHVLDDGKGNVTRRSQICTTVVVSKFTSRCSPLGMENRWLLSPLRDANRKLLEGVARNGLRSRGIFASDTRGSERNPM